MTVIGKLGSKKTSYLCYSITIFIHLRLEAIQSMLTSIQELESVNVPTQAFVKTINNKPGLKDTNFQVLNARLDTVKYLAENCYFSL